MKAKKVILILADGMRPDSFKNNDIANDFIKNSQYTLNGKTVFPSLTLPCIISLFYGVDPQQHKTTTNVFVPFGDELDGVFEKLYTNQKTTCFFYSWDQLRNIEKPGNINCSFFKKNLSGRLADPDVANIAFDYVKKEKPDFTYLYLSGPDNVGHNYNWMSNEYISIVAKCWDIIDRFYKEFKDEYTFIIVADHGGHLDNHGEDVPEDMTIPMFIRDNDIKPREMETASILDIAPTITKLMCVSPSDKWQGKSLI